MAKSLIDVGFADLKHNPNLEEVVEALSEITAKKSDEDARVLNYMLALAEKFEATGYMEQYAIIGGYAVFSHIYNCVAQNPKLLGKSKPYSVFIKCRGSHDIDLISKTPAIKGILEGNFYTCNVIDSHFAHKYHVELKDEVEELRTLEGTMNEKKPLRLDLFIPDDGRYIKIEDENISDEAWERVNTISILGQKIRIPDITDLVKMKLNVGTLLGKLPRDKDITDIYNLIGVAQNCGLSIPSFVFNLRPKQRDKLYLIMDQFGNKLDRSEEIIIRPIYSYVKSLIKEITPY